MSTRILRALGDERYMSLDGAGQEVEFLLRPFAKAQARKKLRAAESKTQSMDLGHHARIASLLAEGKPSLANYSYEEPSVQADYAKLRPLPAAGPPWGIMSVALALVFGTAGTAWYREHTKPFAPERTPLGAAIRTRLTTYALDAGRGKGTGPDAAMVRVFPDAKSPAAALKPSFASFFTAFEAAAAAPAAMPKLYAATRGLNAAMAKAHEPYYLDSKLWQTGQPLVYAYYTEREREGSAPGLKPERVVYLWRADTLNVRKPALGYTHKEADAALVLLDETEEFVIRDVLPSLVEGETMDLLDKESRNQKLAWQADIEERAAHVVRDTFALDAESAKLLELGKMLSRRKKLIAMWKDTLLDQHTILIAPRRLVPPADLTDLLKNKVGGEGRYEWDDIHDKLTREPMISTFERLRDRVADMVARHELQHRIDGQRQLACSAKGPAECPPLRVPELIAKRAGAPKDGGVDGGTMGGRVRDETSAYLAEMAESPGTARLALVSLLRSVFDRSEWGDEYCYTALAVLDALSEEYTYTDPEAPLVYGGAVQRASVASLVVLLLAKPEQELSAGAGRAWAKLYGEPLPHATWGESQMVTRWRH